MTPSGITEIRPIRAEDAALLFPLVFRSPVTRTLVWDGPQSFAEYQETLADYAEKTRRGELHIFTIVHTFSRLPMGSIGVRPYSDGFRGDIGIWLGEPHQGQGHGADAIALAVQYGFEQLELEKIEACVFTGNFASRRAFEKNAFTLEGTLRGAVRKSGVLRDEWLFGLLCQEYAAVE